MPLKAVTSGAVRSWASPHTMKQLVNNQNGRIISLSISGSFFNVIRDSSPSVESRASPQASLHPGGQADTQRDKAPSDLHAADGRNCAHQSCVDVIRIYSGVNSKPTGA